MWNVFLGTSPANPAPSLEGGPRLTANQGHYAKNKSRAMATFLRGHRACPRRRPKRTRKNNRAGIRNEPYPRQKNIHHRRSNNGNCNFPHTYTGRILRLPSKTSCPSPGSTSQGSLNDKTGPRIPSGLPNFLDKILQAKNVREPCFMMIGAAAQGKHRPSHQCSASTRWAHGSANQPFFQSDKSRHQ